MGLSLLTIGVMAGAHAQELDRERARGVVAELRKIVTPHGVERLERVRIGGIDQWVSIRSRDVRNPVLLVLHGGPGWVSMPSSWYTAHGWDEYFTVIQWDQRGAGKTYLATSAKTVAPTMTIERMVGDTEEMILWARAEFGKEKIFLLGHSWGSILGLRMAERHPDWLHAYVGVGQGVDVRESERRGWRWTMEQAVAANNRAAIQDLQSIAPYAEGEGEIPLADIFLQRRWLNAFGGAAYRRPDASFEGAAAMLAPEYSDEDLQRWAEAQTFSVEHLLPAVLNTDLSGVVRLETPLFLLLGRHDRNVSSEVAAEWFETVEAPTKRLIWFEHSAHEIMAEEPGRTFETLIRLVRPIAAQAGDAAPEAE